MKIKHFAGYGCVNAKKLKHETIDSVTTLIINVSGDHERGLKPYIIDDAIQWLAARYDKNIVNIPWYNIHIDVNNNYGMSCDTLTYTFKYKRGN